MSTNKQYCPNCDPSSIYPDKLIRLSKGLKYCADCGRQLISFPSKISNDMIIWDQYFLNICNAIASKSPCLSRKLGAIIVRDHSILSTGYNGPPRGIPHCGHDRFMKDINLNNVINETKLPTEQMLHFNTECPRKILGYKSGRHMELCPAQHAEENAVSNAARNGTNIYDTILYFNGPIPCVKCFGTLINAGIKEIIVTENKVYDKHTQFLIDNSDIKIREFES